MEVGSVGPSLRPQAPGPLRFDQMQLPHSEWACRSLCLPASVLGT